MLKDSRRSRLTSRVAAALLAAALVASCSDNNQPGSAAVSDSDLSADVIPAMPLPMAHNGRWLTDAQGRVAVLHGINVAMKLRPYTPQAQGFTQEHAAMLAREGFSTVRVWIFWNAIEPSPGVWDDASLSEIKEFVGWLHAYGITTTLNFSQLLWGETFGGLGFPDWAAKTDGYPNVALGSTLSGIGLPTPGGNLVLDGLTNPAVHRAFDNFYANAAYPGTVGLQDQFAAAWTHVARYFRDVPGIVAYDIVNEPEAGSQDPLCLNPIGCPLFDALSLTPFYQRVVTAIRAVDEIHLVFYEPNVYAAAGFATNVAAGDDPRLALTAHFYPLAGSTGIALTAPLALQNFETAAARNGDGLLLTEFGASDDLAQITSIIDAADKARMGWLYWAWYSTEPTGNPKTPTTQIDNPQEGIVLDPAKPPTESNLKVDKLAVLGRPYPYLVSGTPQLWSFDADGRAFTLTYDTKTPDGAAAPSAPTVIIVPRRLYPDGHYQVSVSGGRVTSAAFAMALTIEALPGAASVTVNLAPM
jgi:endoglycosylceramidase